MDWIEVNGASLRYAFSGSGEATVVLLHELGGSIESWDAVSPGFEKQFRVLRYDQRGFGYSEKAPLLSFDSMLGDLCGLLDALQIGPCHVAGSAMGGAIALALASRHPQRVISIAISSPTSCSALPQAYLGHLETRAQAVREGGMRAIVDAALRVSYPEILRGDTARFERYKKRWLTNDPESFIAANRVVPTDLSAELKRVTCPALVMGCVHDSIRTPAFTRLVAESLPNARFVEVDSGHFMAIQTPELFLAHVVPFFCGA
ncbi:MAG: alpha/beta fold hydrolase [Burkholderiales bacterium]